MNEFFTWELLATYSGACVATGILVEFLKGLLPGLPPRLLECISPRRQSCWQPSSLPVRSPSRRNAQPAQCRAGFPWQPAAAMSSANPLWQRADPFFLRMTV